MLCRWAVAKAREGISPVSLFESGMGEILGERLCFKQVGVVHMLSGGEEDVLNFPAIIASTW